MIHKYIRIFAGQRLSYPTFLQDLDESLIILPVDRLEMPIDKVAETPNLALERPFILVMKNAMIFALHHSLLIVATLELTQKEDTIFK